MISTFPVRVSWHGLRADTRVLDEIVYALTHVVLDENACALTRMFLVEVVFALMHVFLDQNACALTRRFLIKVVSALMHMFLDG